MKILFFASYPNLPIGYSRIGNIISNHMAEQEHEVYYFGISNFKNNVFDRYIHPSIVLIDVLEEEKKIGTDELYGVNCICNFINSIQPDLLFLYNDIIVISRIFNNLIEKKITKNFKICTYLDLVYPYEKLELINYINDFSDLIIVFSDYWKDNLIQMKINPEKIVILPHGFDNIKFFDIDKLEARKYFNFDPEDFIILNSNRNSYRKNIELTIDAFIYFLKLKNMNKKIKLFLNMNIDNMNSNNSCDIFNQIQIACLKYDLNFENIITNNIFINSSEINYSDKILNYLYNACDIGINTCIGEGFGLCNLEHGGLGRPQIISGVGGLIDIFKPEYSIIVEPIGEYYISNNLDFHGGYAKICSVNDFVNGLITYYENPELIKIHGETLKKNILERYNWDNILLKLDNILLKVINN